MRSEWMLYDLYIDLGSYVPAESQYMLLHFWLIAHFFLSSSVRYLWQLSVCWAMGLKKREYGGAALRILRERQAFYLIGGENRDGLGHLKLDQLSRELPMLQINASK